MSKVDPNDDTIRRWVIHHYRYDPVRNQRRYVVVAAFDSAREYEREFDRYSDQVQAEIAAGTRSDREQVSGTVLEAGHRASHARARDLKRAMQHGVAADRFLRSGPLPSSVSRYREPRFAVILRALGFSGPRQR